MKVPKEITTLFELAKWGEENNPEIIEIEPDAKINQIREFSTRFWKYYRGIEVKYL
jgi:hypothetical protein